MLDTNIVIKFSYSIKHPLIINDAQALLQITCHFIKLPNCKFGILPMSLQLLWDIDCTFFYGGRETEAGAGGHGEREERNGTEKRSCKLLQLSFIHSFMEKFVLN